MSAVSDEVDRLDWLASDAAALQEATALAPEEPQEAAPPEYTDDALALRFSERHKQDARYTAQWGRWHLWNGQRWELDETLRVQELAREVCRQSSIECLTKHPKLASRLASAQTVSGVERLARADRRHAATAEQWDADPWLLNTPGGVVNLRTGYLRPHARQDYHTKITGSAPGGDCPLWLKFLNTITAGDVELQAYLQRMAGYALTGSTAEHAVFFLYGTGANGKSVFLSTLSGVFADYGRTAPIEAFIASSSEHHPTDLASLQGARLVTAVETDAGRKWAESKLKSLTGGDRIAARFMRQDFFQFTPQFKLIVAGNHKPGLRSVDEAMRRRLNLIPFTVTIPAEDRDPYLAEKLKSEWGGVLRWAIDGCLDWQRVGLNAPEAVRAATEDYLTAEDSLGRWLEECCETGPSVRDVKCLTSELYDSWKAWTETAGERPGSSKRFSQLLEGRGFRKARQHGGGRCFAGVAVRKAVG